MLEKEPEYAEFKQNMGGGIPGIQYAVSDLNFDGKNEIIVRLIHEYSFRDRRNNVQTYIYAQTSKGLIKILDIMAGEVAAFAGAYMDLKTLQRLKV